MGKPVLVGFTLDYSTAMNATTAGNTANYQVTSTTTKRVKKQTVTVFTPVAVECGLYPVERLGHFVHQGGTEIREGRPDQGHLLAAERGLQ